MADGIGKRYILHERLGGGGMGLVYRATDRLTGNLVALKQVTKATEDMQLFSDSKSASLRLALAQEFKVLAGLRHPHIISVLDYGFDDAGQPYFTMDLLENPHTILDAGWKRGLKVQVRLLVQMFQALAYLHRRGILHRDLKPENVFVIDGQVKVLDFGLALWREQAHADDVTGTLAYMAPETLVGRPPTESTDLYSAGVIAYELFAGRYLYSYNTVSSLVNEILNTPPNFDLLDVPRELESTLSRLLAKNPEDRYHTAAEVIAALQTAARQKHITETVEIRESFLQAARFVGRESELKQLSDALENITISIVGAHRDAPILPENDSNNVGATHASPAPPPENDPLAVGAHRDAPISPENDPRFHASATPKPIGSAWLIGGESGVGKSRLIEELRTLALVKGALVLRGQAVSEGGGPYFPWRDILRRLVLTVEVSTSDAAVLRALVPDIADLLGRAVPDALELDPGPAQTRLLGVLSSLFRRLQQPMLIILEDLHWAGTESLAVLGQLGQIIADLPLMVVGSFRDDEQPDLPARFPDIRLLRLERLKAAAITELSESMLGEGGKETRVVELLQRETEGNVFFLVEVVRALAEEAGELNRIGSMILPPQVFTGGVQQIIERRLERIPSRARPLLNLAAIAGRQLDLNVLRNILENASLESNFRGIDLERWLTACGNAAVLEVQDTRWRFAHDKLRDGILAALDDTERASLHHQVATAIENLYLGDLQQAALLAHHWDMAGQSVKAVFYAGLAGYQALEISAYKEAANFFERSLALTNDDTPEKSLLQRRLASAYWGLSRYADAETLFEASLTLCRASEDTEGMAEALRGLGDVARRKGDYAGAKAYFSETLNLCRTSGDQVATGLALVRMGVISRILGEYDEARRFYLDSLNLFEFLGERVRLATVHSGLGLVASDVGDHATALRYMEASLEIAREVHNPTGTALVLTGLAWTNYLQGAFARARDYSLESLVLSREAGDRWMVANNFGNLGKILIALNDAAAATRHFNEALKISIEIGAVPLTLEILPGVARMFQLQGQTERAVELLSLALHHPASYSEVKSQAEPLIDELQTHFSPEKFAAALERGRTCELAALVAGIVGG